MNYINKLTSALYDKKGVNIIVIDIRGLSSLNDYMVVVEGTSDRHTKALARAAKDAMEKAGVRPLISEGEDYGEWIVIDFGDVFIHLFAPGWRQKYRLEQKWKAGKIVDVELK